MCGGRIRFQQCLRVISATRMRNYVQSDAEEET